MHDKELVLEILRQIEEAAQKIISRFLIINVPGDFADSQAGMEKMDSICMMLIVIGESLKKLDKITDQKFLSQYPDINWVKAKGMRDIITHHYADINAETIFFTCERKIPKLFATIQKMIKNLKI